MNKIKGFRGYIGSRKYNNYNVPHHVQNLVIRDYCQRNGLVYLLSVTEYSMPGSYLMLEEILRELSDLNGIVMHSIFMLPEDRKYRERLCKRILDKNNSIHDIEEEEEEIIGDILTLDHDKTNTNILITQENSLNYGYKSVNKPNIYVYNAFNADDEDEEMAPNAAEEEEVPENEVDESPSKQELKKVD